MEQNNEAISKLERERLQKDLSDQINNALNHRRWFNFVIWVDENNQLQHAYTTCEYLLDDFPFVVGALKDIQDREVGRTFQPRKLPTASERVQNINELLQKRNQLYGKSNEETPQQNQGMDQARPAGNEDQSNPETASGNGTGREQAPASNPEVDEQKGEAGSET